jgi:hypothetical protein
MMYTHIGISYPFPRVRGAGGDDQQLSVVDITPLNC